MASNSEEKQGLIQSFKSQIGYGTAPVSAASKKMTPRTQKFINRKLGRADTLQGIALRYGVSVQDLKRENRLYTNDSLFLRETLLIPLTPDSEDRMGPDDEIVAVDGTTGKLLSPPPAAKSGSGDGPHHSAHLFNGGANGSAAVLQIHDEVSGTSTESGVSGRSLSDPTHAYDHHGAKNGNRQPSPDFTTRLEASVSSAAPTPNPSANDFFSKYDQNIAFLKGEVARMENNATNLDGLMEANPLALPFRKGSQSSSSGWASYQVSDDETDGAPVLLIRSRTNSRQVKTTLERSQQASDELFEL